MSDKDFLNWVLGRLQHVHGENPNYDYMIRLKNLIDTIDTKAVRLTPVRDVLESEIEKGKGKSEAVDFVSEKLQTTRVSLYRWLKDDMHYVSEENGFRCVYNLVKLIEIE